MPARIATEKWQRTKSGRRTGVAPLGRRRRESARTHEQPGQTENSMASVMQAGRWRDTRMPMRYGEKVLASRGAMARAAKGQGRA
jgi:hypothetical protein